VGRLPDELAPTYPNMKSAEKKKTLSRRNRRPAGKTGQALCRNPSPGLRLRAASMCWQLLAEHDSLFHGIPPLLARGTWGHLERCDEVSFGGTCGKERKNLGWTKVPPKPALESRD